MIGGLFWAGHQSNALSVAVLDGISREREVRKMLSENSLKALLKSIDAIAKASLAKVEVQLQNLRFDNSEDETGEESNSSQHRNERRENTK